MASLVVDHTKKIPIKILISLLLCKLVASDFSMFSTCVSNYTERVNKRTGEVAYESNLQSLFNNLAATGFSNSLSFYNTTAGNPPDRSYGMYLCRGDVTAETCHSCVNNVTDYIVSFNIYANCTELVAFSDYCTLRYANYSFFGKASYMDLGYSVGKFSETIPQAYNLTLDGAVENVTMEAAYRSSEMFATAEEKVDEHEKVYVLAQCTPDISRGDCDGCLKMVYEHLHQNTTGFIKEAWALLPSCQLRYDNATFFGGSTDASNQATSLVFAAFMVTTLSLFFIGLV